MTRADDPADIDAIRALVGGHFEALRWSPDLAPDWARFAADFVDCATLFPAARPVAARTVGDFVERMTGVAETTLHSFEEHTSAVHVRVFGEIALAWGLSWMLENGTEENRDVSAYLLVKSQGKWRIAAHAWQPLQPGEEPPGWLAQGWAPSIS